MAKSLKDLLEEADALLGASASSTFGEASEGVQDDVSALADFLTAGADTLPHNKTASEDAIKSSEDLIEHINRVQFAVELAQMIKVAEFEDRAAQNGFSKEEIDEAISKIAASNLSKNISVLARIDQAVGADDTDNGAYLQWR